MTTSFMDSTQQQLHRQNKGLEALRQQLFCTYMELDHIRKASKMQAKLTDAKLQKLQGMLDATVKERDGAFQECKKLRQCVLNLSNKSPEPIQCMYPPIVSEGQDMQSAGALSNTEHPRSNTTTSEPFQENNLALNTLAQDTLSIFTGDNSWQMDTSCDNSDEQFTMAIASAFDKLDSLELPELQQEENIVSEWEAHLAKASLSSPSSVDSTATSQVPTKGNTEQHPLEPKNRTTGLSSLDGSTIFKINTLVGDPFAVEDPINGTPSISSNVSSLSAQTPVTTMSMKAHALPSIRDTSGPQSTSANVHLSCHLPISANVSPSMSASQSASPIATMSNHLLRLSKPAVPLLAMPASQSAPTTSSAYSPARMPNWFSMPAKLNPSTTSTSAPTPPAFTTPMPLSQSAPILTRHYSCTIQEASLPSPLTPLQNTTHITSLQNGQSKPFFSSTSPQFSKVVPTHTSPTYNQMPAITLSQKRRHLPEPPEANMDTMLSSLPKKGRLLEAVLQAGPLLQQLMLTGPMPQWQHRPRKLNTTQILKVPTSPNSVLSPFSNAQNSPLCLYANQFPFTSTI
ncbi:hypothetical protein GOP47_0019627 [Adiantum capillus-veneris]|uniref:Uncharacterized protein n=1 Tax=Adiantum capillus-veneris TaxID=13818 RepID=A0A9D4UC56_ADICA|nr:hypothetical protein GOP47_0019627 [Adiantum capillus-veneris]